VILHKFESALPGLFGRYPFPPGSLGVLVESISKVSQSTQQSQPFSIKDFIGDGFLWAVPKHRRTIEKRMKMKYGSPNYHMKILQPKHQLKLCDNCGFHFEANHLCPTCYDKVRKETELIKDKIMSKLKLDKVESEVVVLYDGEKGQQSDEFWKGKRIVEMEKPRPSFFSKNLLQKSTHPNATTKQIKPNELG